jgi:hypothetical protein
MSGPRELQRAPVELIDARPTVNVQDAEYVRLLGYPKEHRLTGRAAELAAWARSWFMANARPWVYAREASLEIVGESLRIDGDEFPSKALLDHLRRAEASRVALVAVSAGAESETHAAAFWREGKPDEYFFLEVFASAAVESLVASLSGRLCEGFGGEGLVAIPHYSPGYSGWDVAEQPRLFDLIRRGKSQEFPGALETLASGMLRPKKSLLALVGLAPRTASNQAALSQTPCVRCAFSPCQYRRAPYRYASPGRYSINERALKKWAEERVQVEMLPDGSVLATFRFDGTTCSNEGQPLAFDYRVQLDRAGDGFVIAQSDCRPAEGDEGHRRMCEYLRDKDELMRALAEEKPLFGRPLDEVLQWTQPTAPSGCHCLPENRAHKWRLALEAIHFRLSQVPQRRWS